MENESDRVCNQCKGEIGEDGHVDSGETDLAFCQSECEYQYDVDTGLPDDYQLPWDYQGLAAHKIRS